jgi:hypothetical protein
MAFLDRLPAKLERNTLRGALRAAAMVVAADAKERTTSSEVREGIYVTTGAKDGGVYAKVKLKGFAASVGIWGEYGTAAHWISIDKRDRKVSIRTINRNERLNHSLVIGGAFVGPSVHHPGARPHPFLRPSLDAREADAIKAAGDYIRSKLEAHGLDAPDFGVSEGDDL